MPRRRQFTEMVGTVLRKSEYELLKSEMKRRKLTVAEYLRQTAIAPLMAELASQAEVQDEQK